MWTNELNLLQDKGHCNNLSQSKGVYIKTGVQAVLILLLSPCMECCRDVGCLSTSVDREESTEGRTKESAWHSEKMVLRITVYCLM